MKTTTYSMGKRIRGWVAAVGCAAVMLAGCVAPAATVTSAGQAAGEVLVQTTAQAQPTLMKIKALDYSYELPSAVPSGYVTIVMENAGQEAHHAQLLRLNDGVTPDQFFAAAQQSDAEALALASLPGGPGPIEAGESQTVTLNLAPGFYVLICLLPSHDGMTHLQKGMVATFTVSEAKGAATPEPVAEGTARLLDFSFVLPAKIAAGQQVWKIANEGKQAHELSLIKLAPGKTMQDVMAWAEHMQGEPPYTNAGGMQAIMPGTAAWLDLDLPPGHYVALCHVPDVASGQPHEMLGMVMPFVAE